MEMDNQQELNKSWAERNKERRRFLSFRSTSRTFIRNYATNEDLHELQTMIQKRLNEFK